MSYYANKTCIVYYLRFNSLCSLYLFQNVAFNFFSSTNAVNFEKPAIEERHNYLHCVRIKFSYYSFV